MKFYCLVRNKTDIGSETEYWFLFENYIKGIRIYEDENMWYPPVIIMNNDFKNTKEVLETFNVTKKIPKKLIQYLTPIEIAKIRIYETIV